jgi:indole-3-glycerol phosphate synthase
LLLDLYAGAIQDALAREQVVSREQIYAAAENATPALRARDFLYDSSRVRVISEIKRASPSRGEIAAIENPRDLARVYEEAGAGAISVLTEGRKFRGSLEDLDSVRAAVSVPVLRKDFIANEYQVLEARAHGADIVLLIAAGLEPQTLRNLKTLIEDLGMSALVETHSEAEVLLACEIGAELIGINARDLETFETDRALFWKLVSLIDTDAVKIAESAVRSVADVVDYASQGADCVLVGEALVTGDAAALVRSFSEVQKP